MRQIDETSNAVRQSLHVEINKMIRCFLPRTIRKLNDVLEGLHNEVKEELKNCHKKYLKLQEAHASLMEIGRDAKGEGEGKEQCHEGQEEEEEKGHYWRKKVFTFLSCQSSYSSAPTAPIL